MYKWISTKVGVSFQELLIIIADHMVFQDGKKLLRIKSSLLPFLFPYL